MSDTRDKVDVLQETLDWWLQSLMAAGMTTQIGAGCHARTPECTTTRNGVGSNSRWSRFSRNVLGQWTSHFGYEKFPSEVRNVGKKKSPGVFPGTRKTPRPKQLWAIERRTRATANPSAAATLERPFWTRESRSPGPSRFRSPRGIAHITVGPV